MRLSVVILAAGQGTRMRSDLPKVLHPVAGTPMLAHVMGCAQALRPETVYVVYGHGGDLVSKHLADWQVEWVEQAQQLGTGHAVAQALPGIPDDHTVLVLYGDVPLITADTLSGLVSQSEGEALALLTVHLEEPKGYGRIVRDDAGTVCRIVEEKDASDPERRIKEANTGILAVQASRLKRWVDALDNRNAQGEFYLTDVIAMAVADGVHVKTEHPATIAEVLGVNDRIQLAAVERLFQRRQADALMRQGVSFLDPDRFDLRGELTAGRDISIDINVILEGRIKIGDRVTVGANCWLRNVEVAEDVEILPNCVIEDAVIGPGSRIGPFASLRPGTLLGREVHVGNFVEIKKSQVGEKSKINHLSYVGDSTVGERVNIGAGTITCNYDGANKHRTVIGDDAFIGSDTQLVAPVEVGAGATIGAGSTIVRDTPPGTLTLSRAKQLSVPGWQRPSKKPRESS